MRQWLIPLALLLAVPFSPVLALPDPDPGVPTAPTGTVVAQRSHVDGGGAESLVDTRTVSVSVSQTSSLRARQQIQVSWSGARPTGGVAADANSSAARHQEYPVVLLECRGVDSAAAPANQRLDPTTCWTQTPDERYQQDFNTEYPAWRLDRYAPSGERQAVVGEPSPNPCLSRPTSARFVPFVAADGHVFSGGSNGCAGIPPEAVTVQDPASPPGNTTYGVTRLDGTGSASFVVWTGQQNSSLGCSTTVPCALVVVPVVGISCDLSTADAADADACRAAGRYDPGELAKPGDVTKGFGDTSVTGALWWSASNWQHRLVFPLTFAQAANSCDILDTRTPLDLYGSELMNQATVQWAPAFCRDPRRFKFRHVRTGEPQAKSALAAGTVSAAMVSRPPTAGYAVPTVNAPIAVTGFAITYVIDDREGHPVTELKLNARLLAKLLSESYWSFQALHSHHAAIKNNPQDLSVDPEFTALNPGIGPTVQTQTSATLLALSGDSDLMYALTSYLNADQDARSFLDGHPDPWGAVVNPAYKGIQLPQEFWPLLDDFLDPSISLDGCLLDPAGQVKPVPVLPLIAAPMASLTTVAQAMQFALANPGTNCVPRLDPSGAVVGGTLKPLGRQQPGFRFMLGITSLGDASLYGLRPALLQSEPGRFVAPGQESMLAAVRQSQMDSAAKYWKMSYPLTGDAYPGTVIVYAAVPVTGLERKVAGQVAQLLRFAVSQGQQPGLAEGQLPPGYLPMTSLTGLSGLAGYTIRAADAIEAQSGEIPPLEPLPSYSPPPSPKPPRAAPSASVSPTPELSPWTPSVKLPVGYTKSLSSQLAGLLLPLVIALGLVLGLITTVLWSVASGIKTTSIRARLRQLAGIRSHR